MTQNQKIKIAIETLGCKVNQAESESISRQLAAAGYKVVSADDTADVYILNTCTVTHAADRKSRHWLRMAHRRSPGASLVVTGCYAERAAADLAKLEGIKLVIGNTDKSRLVEILNGLFYHSNLGFASGFAPRASLMNGVNRDDIRASNFPSRTRAFIKVQDGCSNFCAYCIVPFVRSIEASLPPEQVISEIKKRQEEGYKEVVITGVEVGSYDFSLQSLLTLILAETAVPRLRLSSLQPPEVTPELIGLWQNPRLCRHFHLSLQSGSNTVLKRMNRRYTTADYARAVSLIRSAAPEAAITTDIITGFPGETEAEFTESYEFCKQMDFARIHVFPYSPREGTRAAGFTGQVDEKVKKMRTDKMLKLGEECVSNFGRKFLGRTVPVLFEQREKDGLWSGLTDNYIRVYVENEENLTNTILDVRLTEVYGEGVKGEPSEADS